MHCRVAAKNKNYAEKSGYFVLFRFKRWRVKLKQFYTDTKTEDIPYCMLKARPFIYMAGLNLPTIYLINDSKVEHG